MEAFLARYGLLAVLVGAAVEGDTSMLLGGVLAHVGAPALPLVLAAGTLGAFAGDCVLFAVGRRGGPRLRRSRVYIAVAPVVERVAGRFGLWQVVGARFVYGTRVATMLFWGLRGTAFARFAAVDLVGCAAWACVLGLLGFAASGTAAAVLGKVERSERWLAAAAFAAVCVAAFVRLLRHRALVGWRRRRRV